MDMKNVFVFVTVSTSGNIASTTILQADDIQKALRGPKIVPNNFQYFGSYFYEIPMAGSDRCYICGLPLEEMAVKPLKEMAVKPLKNRKIGRVVLLETIHRDAATSQIFYDKASHLVHSEDWPTEWKTTYAEFAEAIETALDRPIKWGTLIMLQGALKDIQSYAS